MVATPTMATTIAPPTKTPNDSDEIHKLRDEVNELKEQVQVLTNTLKQFTGQPIHDYTSEYFS